MTLSVVVTIVDGGAALERCLAALAAQRDAPPLEVLVPSDDTVSGMDALAARHPAVRWLPLGRIATRRPAHTAAGQHELFDRRRAAGLAAATGDLVAILEDRGIPRPDWARTAASQHARLPHEAIGGAIAWGGRGVLSWAVFACDFGRYAPPQREGPRAWISDMNVCYKREALERTRALWRERYHEPAVHWELLRHGGTLWLTPDLVVDEVRNSLSWRALPAERVAWGRLFAATRAARLSIGRRLLLAAATPLLPALLYARIAASFAPRAPGRLLAATPALAMLLSCWSAGECLGYLSGRE
jgi:hypothetical protein